MRGLHHWGASMIIVVVVLHMVQVFLYGAYKKPREATWMVGVVLLLVTLAYGLTGYLLPWDNRAYWGTVVTTQIAGTGAGAGPVLVAPAGRRGRDRRGDLRALLRIARAAAAAGHRLPHRAARLPGAQARRGAAAGRRAACPGKSSTRSRSSKIRSPSSSPSRFSSCWRWRCGCRSNSLADPTDTSYIPRPEWYFLFLFQTLKLFNGPLEVVGSVVLPGLAVLALILVPFIDRSRMVKVTRRTVAMAFVVLAAIGWGGLTAAAVMIHSEGSRGGGSRLLGAHGLDAALARGNGGHRLLPPGKLRQLPRHRRAWHGRRTGPDQDLHPQGRGLDDPAFQTALGDAPRDLHAAHPADRRAVEFAGGFSAEAQR